MNAYCTRCYNRLEGATQCPRCGAFAPLLEATSRGRFYAAGTLLRINKSPERRGGYLVKYSYTGPGRGWRYDSWFKTLPEAESRLATLAGPVDDHALRIQMAAALGKEAFAKGQPRIPALDVRLQPLLAEDAATPILKAWLTAWDDANLAMPSAAQRGAFERSDFVAVNGR